MKHKCLKTFLLLFAISLMTSCEKPTIEDEGGEETSMAQKDVIIRVADMDAGWDGDASRSQVSISEVCNHLQFAVYQNDTRVASENQIIGDADFGTFALQLEEGAYQLLVLGHSGAANIATKKPEKLQFTNPGTINGTGFTDTFYYYGDMAVSSNGVRVDIDMKRATSMFRLKTNDGKPKKVKKFKFYYTGGSGVLDATTGLGCVDSKQTVFVTLDDSQTGKLLTFEMYTFLHQESDTVSFTVTAYDDQDSVLYEKAFKAPMRRNCITQYTGNFFTNDDGKTPDDGPSSNNPSSNVVYVDVEWDNIFEYTF